MMMNYYKSLKRAVCSYINDHPGLTRIELLRGLLDTTDFIERGEFELAVDMVLEDKLVQWKDYRFYPKEAAL